MFLGPMMLGLWVMAPLFRVKFTEAFIMPICFNNCFSMAETQDEQVIPVICNDKYINYSYPL